MFYKLLIITLALLSAQVSTTEAHRRHGEDMCRDCVEWYGQCDGYGDEWRGGEKCCQAGSRCIGNKWYKQCRPQEPYLSGKVDRRGNARCVGNHGTCGGNYYDGPGCCGEGEALTCVWFSEWHSRCVEMCKA